jgi:hypothetical protein
VRADIIGFSSECSTPPGWTVAGEEFVLDPPAEVTLENMGLLAAPATKRRY